MEEWLQAARGKGLVYLKIEEKWKEDNFGASSEAAMLARN